MMQTTLHDSSGILVYGTNDLTEIQTGSHPMDASGID